MKLAMKGIAALLALVVVIALGAWFVWEMAMFMIHDQIGRSLLGLIIILGIVGALKSQGQKSEGAPE